MNLLSLILAFKSVRFGYGCTAVVPSTTPRPPQTPRPPTTTTPPGERFLLQNSSLLVYQCSTADPEYLMSSSV
ncbi:unnamed protein product [Haemonchus placei]|uniref:Secreted protein n=1 Tax=Haemonchus placei TaxID=6290 RepID=A0A0N4WPK3_HAEPC|nr:unnamed protein product [Haemonchus placei]